MAGLQDAPMVTDNITETSVPASTPAKQTFHVGTRQSLLARVQADEVVKALKAAWPDHTFEIHAMSTTGDNNQKTALHKFNEKALWTQELEVLLQNRELDLIVHSLKDMPTQLPVDLILGCVTKREDPRDALVIKPTLAGKYKSLAELPEGSVIGTSSLRRTAQLKRHYPHLSYADVRGNIGTRLAKLDNPDGEYSAIVIAVAGLERLGLGKRITTFLSKNNGGMLHAVGQGALGIESRKDDTRVAELLAKIGCERTTRAALAERSLMRTLEGGCSVPIGVETEWVSRKGILDPDVGLGVKPAEEYHKLTGVAETGLGRKTAEEKTDDLTDELIMRAIVVSLDGQETAEVETRKRLMNQEDADEFGWEVAKQLVAKGADKILKGITLNRGIIAEQGDA
ncbi:hypothetical protein LTR36_002028 [Oleoguttula mirabilis]|uniref:Porphobilinogen deaminase n=1 Tax=Oleoguttula mirabilis TaxID=1507867 RepID=A0AAV9JLG3_9PEZI|nr:hypothetical protein LTR36_002028 [Oleoguttula mirabilis]